MMRRQLVLLLLVCALPAIAAAQPDSLRIGIHQLESEQHKWDDVKLVDGVGPFVHGKAAALRGDIRQAIVEFQKGAKKHRPEGYFNIGLAYFHLHNYPTAIQYFKKSERIHPDVLCNMYRLSAMRIMKEKTKAPKK